MRFHARCVTMLRATAPIQYVCPMSYVQYVAAQESSPAVELILSVQKRLYSYRQMSE